MNRALQVLLVLTVLVIAGCATLREPILPRIPGATAPVAEPETPAAPTGVGTTAVIVPKESPATPPVPENKTDKTEEFLEIPPEFDGLVLTFIEGDLVQLKPRAIDDDGDKVTYAFSTPIAVDGTWQTKIGDEGRYLIKVAASDGKSTTDENILLILRRANRPPVIDCKEKAVIKEGERFTITDWCTFSDEDNEEVVLQYAGWPGYSRYTTTYDDAGEHTLSITANDKTHVVKHELPILVANVNRAPEFATAFPKKIVVGEGDVVAIETKGVADPDGDTVTFTFSKPLDEKGVWQTKIGDAGTYTADIVASDGATNEKRTVALEIKQTNTKPTLKQIEEIVVDEGATVKLPIVATDREGDKLTVTISGWMTSDTYTTTYVDAGDYTTKVVVSDGVLETSQVVHITIVDVNRPPRFVTPA